MRINWKGFGEVLSEMVPLYLHLDPFERTCLYAFLQC
jgi:hypothetical protein